MIDKTTSQNDRRTTRQHRVESLRQRIAAGTYVVSAELLAERMLRAAQAPTSSFWVQ
jgi:anti-sigma28 factor (negative regulator of flagellin synthesis)